MISDRSTCWLLAKIYINNISNNPNVVYIIVINVVISVLYFSCNRLQSLLICLYSFGTVFCSDLFLVIILDLVVMFMSSLYKT